MRKKKSSIKFNCPVRETSEVNLTENLAQFDMNEIFK